VEGGELADLLVRLYALPDPTPLVNHLASSGIIIRRAHPAESEVIVPWVNQYFQPVWVAEVRASLAQRPVTCFIATEIQVVEDHNSDPYHLPPEKLLGFACYDTVARGMFGPEGVHPGYRKRGIGKALLILSLQAMLAEGYAYAVISWAGPVEFYERTVGAILIEDSEPGIFRGPLITE